MQVVGKEAGASRGAAAGQRGQTMAEFALGATLFFMVLVGALHFALTVHVRHVVESAAVEGARWAAAEPVSIARGEARARSVLQDGLGRWSHDYTVQGVDQGDTVLMRVEGHYIFALPLLGSRTIPLATEAVVRKEEFRPGP